MDALDIRILRELEYKPQATPHAVRGVQRPWDIARRLGVHGNTVKARLEALRESGVLRSIVCAPSDAALGTRTHVYGFRWPSVRAKREGLRVLLESGSLGYHYDFLGTEAWAAIQMAPDEAADARARLFAHASGAESFEHLWSRPPVPEPRPALTALDYRIMLAFHADALKPHSDAAEEVGVTAKTVRVRFNRLLENRMMAVTPLLNLGASRGDCAYALVVRFKRHVDEATRNKFTGLFENVISRRPPGPHTACLSLAAPTMQGAEDDVALAEGHEAVESARVLFFIGTDGETGLLRARLESRIRALTELPES